MRRVLPLTLGLMLAGWLTATPREAAGQFLARPDPRDAREILRTPLDASIGRVESLRVRRFAVLNGYCSTAAWGGTPISLC